ncbi:PhnD/SsuA/transferrin family substrate-binding protein [Methanolobus sp. WCC1]|jgi:phosphonate transport system substrate-binding protein|uniref:ABC-type phosphate/phosphonate transport system, periplasmic component n=1 Tax=Methanolobus tindarius DSM 2278 TaxID=1090322 RepID=W9DR97_METTI|nr:PhnD/SsuA/transferrin family substrate-binding protein [Methanolobus tindarius]ETA69254.1 ABC-type phosphate/phosphonate transport system, periplasmic component [Methanolobus tindarius DSM 2278]
MKNKPIIRCSGCIFVLLLIFTTVIISSGCFESEEAVTVSLKNTETLTQSDINDKPVRIGVFAMASPKITMEYYNDFLNYLSEQTNLEFELVQRDNPAEINYLLETGYLDFVFVREEDYLSGHDDFGLEIVAVPVINGDLYCSSLVIVRGDSGIDSLENLHGKKFAFNSYRFNRGDIVPDYMHPFIDGSPDDFFSGYIYSNSQDNFIDMVHQGSLDGAEIDCIMWSYMVESSSEDYSDLSIIYSSSGQLVPVVAVNPDIDQELKNDVAKTLLGMHDSREGREVLEEMHFNMFVEMDHETYAEYGNNL